MLTEHLHTNSEAQWEFTNLEIKLTTTITILEQELNQESTLVSTPHIHKQSQLEQKLKLHPPRFFSSSDENMGFVYNSS